MTHCDVGKIAIGCEIHTYKEWLDNYKEIVNKHGYKSQQIKEYKEYIDFFIPICKRRDKVMMKLAKELKK